MDQWLGDICSICKTEFSKYTSLLVAANKSWPLIMKLGPSLIHWSWVQVHHEHVRCTKPDPFTSPLHTDIVTWDLPRSSTGFLSSQSRRGLLQKVHSIIVSSVFFFGWDMYADYIQPHGGKEHLPTVLRHLLPLTFLCPWEKKSVFQK